MQTLPKFVLLVLLTVYLVWGSTYLAIHFARPQAGTSAAFTN